MISGTVLKLEVPMTLSLIKSLTLQTSSVSGTSYKGSLVHRITLFVGYILTQHLVLNVKKLLRKYTIHL